MVDAVCSVASEEIQMDKWDIDVVLSASQKGLGTPPGLSILVASERALQVSFPFTCLGAIYKRSAGFPNAEISSSQLLCQLEKV